MSNDSCPSMDPTIIKKKLIIQSNFNISHPQTRMSGNLSRYSLSALKLHAVSICIAYVDKWRQCWLRLQRAVRIQSNCGSWALLVRRT